MVGAFGEVQIIDWGFARVLGSPAVLEDSKTFSLLDQALSPQESSALSVAGVPIGTPAYMAPEQALGDLKALDERTDVFCLGSILVEILTGKPPYASESVREVMDAAAKADLRPVYARLDQSGAEADLVAIVKDCLRAAKNARPKNAGEVAERISAFLAAAGERARQAELTAERERTRAVDERRKKQMVLALAGAVVLAGVAIGWVSWSKAQKRQRVEHEIGLIVGEAESHAKGEDWKAAEERALHAEAALKGADAGDALRARVAELVRHTRAKGVEHDAMKELYKLRMHPSSPPEEMDRRYAEEFKKIGIDIDVTPPADVGRSVRSRSAAAAELLVLALDDWTMRFKPRGERGGPRGRPGPPDRPPGGEEGRPPRREPPDGGRPEERQNPERRRRILEAAVAADDHAWRNRLRAAMLAEDRGALEELARTVEEKTPPAPSIIMLGQAMARVRRPDLGLSVLQAAFRLYPDDFWVSFLIAHENMPRAGDPDDDRLALCERHARLAVALGPKNPHAHALVASVLYFRVSTKIARPGDAEEALARLRSSATDEGPFGDAAKLALRAHEGDAEARAEIRRQLQERGHPPLIQTLFETAPK
jgi:serine/threonine-protein kinase